MLRYFSYNVESNPCHKAELLSFTTKSTEMYKKMLLSSTVVDCVPQFSRYKILFQYDGSKYSGCQKQPSTHETIQEKLELIFSKLQFSEKYSTILVSSSNESSQLVESFINISCNTNYYLHSFFFFYTQK